MTILHTSDWHLGHLLYGYDRSEEQRDMLRQMVEAAERHRPDAFVISGDIFHTGSPSATAQQMFVETMMQLHNAKPDMPVIVTAGNHDSSSKHEVFRTPWKYLNVHVIGSIDGDNPDSNIIDINGKGFVIAVPYVNERYMPDGLFQSLLTATAERNCNSLPVVLMAHTTVGGSDFSEHENATELTVGGIDSCSLDLFGDNYDYLALGHIHKAQFIRGSEGRARYSGTPLPVTFDETTRHTITLVDIAAHGKTPVVEEIPINNIHPLITLPSNDRWMSWDEARQMLREYNASNSDYLRLNVEVDDFLPAGANAEAEMLLQGKNSRFCHINTRRTRQQESAERYMTVDEFKKESPLDLVRRYTNDMNFSFDDETETIFKHVVELVNEDCN